MFRSVFILFFLSVLNLQAQENDSVKFKPYSVQQFGIVIGENLTSYTLNFCGGVQYKNAKAGLGIGVNGYMIRSMPLYLDLRYEIGKRKTRTFLFSGTGVNLFPSNSSRDNYYYEYYYDEILKKQVGTYAELGVGFKTKISNDLYYNTSFSYMYKKSRFTRYAAPYWDGSVVITDDIEQMTIETGMVSLRVGLDF